MTETSMLSRPFQKLRTLPISLVQIWHKALAETRNSCEREYSVKFQLEEYFRKRLANSHEVDDNWMKHVSIRRTQGTWKALFRNLPNDDSKVKKTIYNFCNNDCGNADYMKENKFDVDALVCFVCKEEPYRSPKCVSTEITIQKHSAYIIQNMRSRHAKFRDIIAPFFVDLTNDACTLFRSLWGTCQSQGYRVISIRARCRGKKGERNRRSNQIRIQQSGLINEKKKKS